MWQPDRQGHFHQILAHNKNSLKMTQFSLQKTVTLLLQSAATLLNERDHRSLAFYRKAAMPMWQKHIVVWTVLTVIDAFTAGWYYLFCCADTLLSCCNGTYSPSVCSFDTQAEACDAYSDGVKKLIWFLVSAGALWGSIFIEILVRRCLTPQIVDIPNANENANYMNVSR